MGRGRIARSTAAVVGAVIGVVVVAMPVAADQVGAPPLPTSTTPGTTTPVNPPEETPGRNSWVTIVNEYRRQSGLAPIMDNGFLSNAARRHSCYMLRNEITHDEVPGRPGYTPDGDQAGNNSNVAISTTYAQSDRRMIDLWMTGPFHAIGILRPNLKWASYGRCDNRDGTFKTAATLNVLSGLESKLMRPLTPVVFPGNGATTTLGTFIDEKPNPVHMCGWSGKAGLPLIAIMPVPATNPWSSLTGPTGNVQVCTLYAGNVGDPSARAILGGENAIVVVPKVPLTPGGYTAKVMSGGRLVTWKFTIKP